MDFKEAYLALDFPKRERFAKLAGTSTGYISNMLLSRRRNPTRPTLEGLAHAAEKLKIGVTREEVISWFFLEPVKPKPARKKAAKRTA